jgi:hypothetical protein
MPLPEGYVYYVDPSDVTTITGTNPVTHIAVKGSTNPSAHDFTNVMWTEGLQSGGDYKGKNTLVCTGDGGISQAGAAAYATAPLTIVSMWRAAQMRANYIYGATWAPAPSGLKLTNYVLETRPTAASVNEYMYRFTSDAAIINKMVVSIDIRDGANSHFEVYDLENGGVLLGSHTADMTGLTGPNVGPVCIGCYHIDTPSHLIGDLGHFFLYDKALSAQERLDIVAWLIAEWDSAPPPYTGLHEVTNIDNAGNANCIYFGQTGTPPGSQDPIKIGDKFSFKETSEINGWGVAIDDDGFPIIDSSGGVGTDSFLFDIDRGAGYNDPSEWTFTIAPPATISNPEHLVQSGTEVLTRATTDTGSGTLYAIIDESPDEPTAQQIVDGLNAAGTAADGAGSVPVTQAGTSGIIAFTGLTPATDYSYWLAQDTGALSNVVGDTITTTEPSAGIEYVLLPNVDGTQRTNYPDGDYEPEVPIVLPPPSWEATPITNITQNSMTVNWVYPSSGTDADGFILQRYITGVSTSWTSHPATNPTPAIGARSSVEQGLPHSTLVRFRLAAKSGDVMSEFSEMFDG